MKITHIRDLTLDDLSSDGSGTPADLIAFKAACVNYRKAHPPTTERDAVHAVFGNGHFWAKVQKWAPVEAAAADAAHAAADAA